MVEQILLRILALNLLEAKEQVSTTEVGGMKLRILMIIGLRVEATEKQKTQMRAVKNRLGVLIRVKVKEQARRA
jgi:hypothetical protein